VKTEDGYIISKCLEGDSSAFGLLVDKYKESVYGLAYSRLRNWYKKHQKKPDKISSFNKLTKPALIVCQNDTIQ